MKYVVDVNNVIRATENEFHVSYLKTLLNLLKQSASADVVCIADANIDHLVAEKCDDVDQILFEEIKKSLGKKFAIVPGGTRADEFILQFADACCADVISNDRYRDYIEKYPWVKEQRRLHKFSVICEVMMIPSLSLRASVSEQNLDCEVGHGEVVDTPLAAPEQIDWNKERQRIYEELLKQKQPGKEPLEIKEGASDAVGEARCTPGFGEEPWCEQRPAESEKSDSENKDDGSFWHAVAGLGIVALAGWVGWEFRHEIFDYIEA